MLMSQEELICFKAGVASAADIFAFVLFWKMASGEVFPTLKLV
jgi:hypothetical protein